jgi:four helix bundle protein
MPTVEKFEQLDVWKGARELANMVYDLSETGKFARDFGLRDQMRRASISIMSDIAEGFEARTQAIFIELLGKAKGSAGELRSQLYLALDRKYIDQDDFNCAFEKVEICSKQLARFIQYLETRPNVKRIKEEGSAYDL